MVCGCRMPLADSGHKQTTCFRDRGHVIKLQPKGFKCRDAVRSVCFLHTRIYAFNRGYESLVAGALHQHLSWISSAMFSRELSTLRTTRERETESMGDLQCFRRKRDRRVRNALDVS